MNIQGMASFLMTVPPCPMYSSVSPRPSMLSIPSAFSCAASSFMVWCIAGMEQKGYLLPVTDWPLAASVLVISEAQAQSISAAP